METFATPEQMEQRTQGEIPATHPGLAAELRAATAAIRDACGWHIAPVETHTLELYHYYGARDVWIPAMQIASIDAVTLDGVVYDPADIYVDRDTGRTNMRAIRATVEYTAGYATVPPALEALTLELAAGALGSAVGIQREQAAGVSVTYFRSGGALTRDDASRLAPFKLGRVQ